MKYLFLTFFVAVLFLPFSVQAAITFVGSNSGTGSNATITVSLTGLSLAEGDLVIALNAFDVNYADFDPGVTTSGYTELFDIWNHPTTGYFDVQASINYKVMGATPDTSVVCNASPASSRSNVCIAYVFRGVDTTTPMDVSAVSATGHGVSSSPNPGSITPSTSGAYVVIAGIMADATNDTSVTVPSGYSNHVQDGVDTGSAIEAAMANKAWTSGAEDPAAWTNWNDSSQSTWAAFTLALRPASTVAAPTVTTSAVSGIETVSATGNGNITDTGGENADERGFVYGTSSLGDPGNTAPASTSYGSYVTDSGSYSTGAFTKTLTGLSGSTIYYVRAYAHNSGGYSYGSEVSFTTAASGAVRKIRLIGVRLRGVRLR